MSFRVAEIVREQREKIVDDWEQSLRKDEPALAHLSREELADHVPALLNGIADWVDQGQANARAALEALADTHALHRLSCGFALDAIHVEYACLRRVLNQQIFEVDKLADDQSGLLELHQALDVAVDRSVRRYTEHRERMRDRFIAILGHDLRNPLNAAVVAVDAVLAMEPLSARSKQRLTVAQRGHRRLAKLIEDLLGFARNHLGAEIPVHAVAGDFREVCLAAFQELQQAHPDRNLSFDCPAPIPACYDHERLHQAVGNLLANAVEHGRDPIRLSARQSAQSVEISVSNAGDAIPESRRAKLFAGAKAVTTGKGLGIGLYVANLVAKAHGGVCEVMSNAEDTTFTLRLPLVHECL